MDYYSAGWVLVALASINTGGGADVQGDVDVARDYTGRDRISIYADQELWRTSVRDKFDDITERFWQLREENQRIRTQLMIAMILIATLFLGGFVATALTIRQIDAHWTHIEDIEDELGRIDQRIERYHYTPPAVPPYPMP